MKKGFDIFFLIFVFTLILSMSFTSGFSFSDFWKNIIGGHAIDENDADLKLWLKFDDDIADGIAADSSGNNNDGACSGNSCPTYLPLGGHDGNGAYEFDGSNDYISLGTMDVVGNEMTISAWFRANDVSGCGPRIISKATGTAPSNKWWAISFCDIGTPSSLRFSLKTDSTSQVISTDGGLATGKWTHVAVIYDGSRMRIYKDGAEASGYNVDNSKTGTISVNSGVNVNIGRNPDGSSFTYFNGIIDEIRIYNRSLSASEIVNLAQVISTECSDGVDNDGNGCADYPTDLGCTSTIDTTEAGGNCFVPECNDGLDNDGDTFIDQDDPDCVDRNDNSEATIVITNVHYVRTGASGNNDGSDWDNAWTTLPATLQRGHTYYIADGTYGGYTFDDAESGTQYITVKKAIIADHGTDNGWFDSYGNGPAIFSGEFNFITSNYIIDGQTGGGPGSWKSGFGFVLSSSGKGIRGTSGSNIVIRHIEIIGRGDDGDGIGIANDLLYLLGGNNYVLTHAYLHDAGRTLYWARFSNIFTEFVYGGKFESTAGQHSEIASIRGNNITFANSIYDHIEGTGGIVVAGDNLKVYGNVFFQLPNNTDGFGNGVITTWTAYTLTNAKVYNNDFISVNGPAVTLLSTPSTGNVAYNNFFYDTNTGSFNNIAHDYNAFYDTSGSGPEEPNSEVGTGDPFVDWQNGDFRLKKASDAGIILPEPYNTDVFGNTRGSDGVWDRGAYEFVSGALPPLTQHPQQQLLLVLLQLSLQEILSLVRVLVQMMLQ